MRFLNLLLLKMTTENCVTKIKQVVVYPIANGKEEFHLPADVELIFLDQQEELAEKDKASHTVFRVCCDGKGGTFEVTEPFEYVHCEGKVWALDRPKSNGQHSYHLYPSGLSKKNEASFNDPSVLHVKIAIQGPFIAFALGIFRK